MWKTEQWATILYLGLSAHFVGLDDSSDEEQKNVLLKGGQVARMNHSLKPWYPAACLTCDLIKTDNDACNWMAKNSTEKIELLY